MHLGNDVNGRKWKRWYEPVEASSRVKTEKKNSDWDNSIGTDWWDNSIDTDWDLLIGDDWVKLSGTN